MPLAIPLLVLLAAFVAYGSAALARSSSGGFINWLAQQAIVTAGGTAWIAKQVVKLTSHVTHALGKHFAEVEHAAAAWVGALASYVDLVGKRSLLLPFELSRFAYWLVRHEIPRLVHALPTAAASVIRKVTTRVVRIERTVVKLPKLSRAQAKALIGAAVATYIGPYLVPLRWLRSHYHALTHALDHALPIRWPREWPRVLKRIKRLERIAAGGLTVAAVVAALGRLRLGWLRCTKVGKAGRAVCGLNSNLFDTLLLDAVAVTSIVSVVEFANDLRAIEDEAITVMRRLVREWPT